MKREEFIVYCLLYAFDAAGIKKQNLVQMALKADAVTFVRIYNAMQYEDADTHKSKIISALKDLKKNETLEEIDNMFLKDGDPSIREKIYNVLENICNSY